jgi:hypothetical protein
MSLRSVRLVLFATAALFLAPSAASAAWTVTPTPNVDGASLTTLGAVDCSSANSCMAVGAPVIFTSTPPTGGPLAERWDGASWQIVPTPRPPGSTFNSLNGVSCPQPNVCFAVGSSTSSSGTTPLVELWNGTRWSIQPSPNVPNGTLGGISCSGLVACTAVGTVHDPSSGDSRPLAERWDPTGWHVQATPDPTGSQNDELVSVSCALRRTCTAVGRSTTFLASGGTSISPLVERWFGRVNSWGLQSAPKPAGAESAAFAGVSCPDGPVCIAVGSTGLGTTNATLLAERRIGPTWSIQPLPDPPPDTFPPRNFSAVSCPARRSCHAIGAAATQIPSGDLIAGHFDGGSWRLESFAPGTPVPSVLFLPGISCPSRVFCMAVGYWQYKFSGATLAAKWTP